MRFGCAPATAWPLVRHLLIPAIAWDGDHDETTVVDQLDRGLAQLWIGEDDRVRCAVVTRLNRTARGLVCEIWLIGGDDRRRWFRFLDRIEAAARERGCIAVELIGRKGWARLLPDYRQKAIILGKAL